MQASIRHAYRPKTDGLYGIHCEPQGNALPFNFRVMVEANPFRRPSMFSVNRTRSTSSLVNLNPTPAHGTPKKLSSVPLLSLVKTRLREAKTRLAAGSASRMLRKKLWSPVLYH